MSKRVAPEDPEEVVKSIEARAKKLKSGADLEQYVNAIKTGIQPLVDKVKAERHAEKRKNAEIAAELRDKRRAEEDLRRGELFMETFESDPVVTAIRNAGVKVHVWTQSDLRLLGELDFRRTGLQSLTHVYIIKIAFVKGDLTITVKFIIHNDETVTVEVTKSLAGHEGETKMFRPSRDTWKKSLLTTVRDPKTFAAAFKDIGLESVATDAVKFCIFCYSIATYMKKAEQVGDNEDDYEYNASRVCGRDKKWASYVLGMECDKNGVFRAVPVVNPYYIE